MWLTKHQNGIIMGICTNKPGDGNRLADDTPEVHEYVEEDPASPNYDAAKIAQAEQFKADVIVNRQNLPAGILDVKNARAAPSP